MSGLERGPEKTRCPEKRGDRIREVSGLERYLDYRGVRIREVSGLERCPD